ncbi:hypothetical protein SAMN04515671_4397 [Nakamurella panacisegetis]|uniref:Phospholipid-binding protein, PBP family n=1 Tax=Nakamurella panacisegetis TaxID=1090615 RepID=A0A1H0T1E7_9ACTN|nr:YbhB/YbcL family Raf kinase inhibitor-like protein [Nakamurella panacisegetis]SDP47550.1 hypothetical protein SAMN04515671_4397 [Nakamurella panacisegetis]
MTLLGTLLRNQRPHEREHTWNQPHLTAVDTIEITSADFSHGSPLDSRYAGKRVGGGNVSPHLRWSPPPAGTTELLLVVEDLDAPAVSKPPVHCMAIIDPAGLSTPNELPSGALDKDHPAPGVTLLRSTLGRGYRGPEPLKGHGPHRYVFEIYALADRLIDGPDADGLLKARPRKLLAAIKASVVARGRITGTHQR